MRWLLTLVIIAATALPSLAEDATQSPAFTKLKDALVFIDHGLDTGDWNGLSHALYPLLQPKEPNRTYWTELKDARGKLSLASIFADQDFPSSNNTFLIKVPRAASIGGSRIRFTKESDGWRINAIYIVR